MQLNFHCNSKIVINKVKIAMETCSDFLTRDRKIAIQSNHLSENFIENFNQKNKKINGKEMLIHIARSAHTNLIKEKNDSDNKALHITSIIHAISGTKIISSQSADIIKSIMGKRVNLCTATIVEMEGKSKLYFSKILIKIRRLNEEDIKNITKFVDFSDQAFLLQPGIEPYIDYISSHYGTTGIAIKKIFNVLYSGV